MLLNELGAFAPSSFHILSSTEYNVVDVYFRSACIIILESNDNFSCGSRCIEAVDKCRETSAIGKQRNR